MASLTISGLTRRFGKSTALDALSVTVEEGEFLAILGPSGCGKTTLLRLIAGFDRPDAGEIRLGDRVFSAPGQHVPPEERGLGMVFQSYALWPHMTVAQNVDFALRIRRLPERVRTARVAEVLGSVGLSGFERRRPAELSGGQRQRVALARCLAMKPDLILMDEPLSNLDAPLREAMHVELRRIHRETGTTILYVTHDQDEAMALANRVLVLHAGRAQQIATPAGLYREPANRCVAEFFGRGVVLPVEPLGPDGDGMFRARIFGHAARLRWTGQLGAEPLAAIKPEDLEIAADARGFAACVTACAFAGRGYRLTLHPLGDPGLALRLDSLTPIHPGSEIRIALRDGFLLPG